MLCAIYKSKNKEGMYLYVAKRNNFESVPDELRKVFGIPIFVMLFNLKGEKDLINADKKEVSKKIENAGYYLQLPKKEENLFESWQKNNKKTTALL